LCTYLYFLLNEFARVYVIHFVHYHIKIPNQSNTHTHTLKPHDATHTHTHAETQTHTHTHTKNTVLSALRNNDTPTPNYGVQILFAYSSPESQIVEQIETEGLTPAQYKNFLSMSDDSTILLTHGSAAIDKADFSPDGRKGYFTARLMESEGGVASPRNDVSVNFILSTMGTEDGDCWLIDSMLIRPSKLRRRRRR